MRHFRLRQFQYFSRMNKGFLVHLDCVADLLKCPVKILKYDCYRKDNGPHGKGIAVHFSMDVKIPIYEQTIKLLNACNEHFREICGIKYRLGVYPEDEIPHFHLDIVQENLFWIGRFRKDEYDQNMGEKTYRIFRSMPEFLGVLYEG